ncbi:hypothetical protein [Methylobacterium sp. ID0610]|uniref:hypothetical protein n=1 Tax=Methylobacterium carpenticola TaxID=3344827 RepID=UPI00368B65AF
MTARAGQPPPGLLAPAGFVVGPVLWAVTTQLGLILPEATCGAPLRLPALAAFPAALLSLAASWLSWRAARPGIAPRAEPSGYPAAFPFVGRAAALAGLVFAYALALQGLAALVLSGCER